MNGEMLMLSFKFKVSALTTAVLLATPIFAKKADTDLDIFSAPAPYTISSISNVFIDAAITPKLNPRSLAAPASYAGTGVLTMIYQNNSVFDVKISCTGNITPFVCTAGDVTSCTHSWLTADAQSIAPFTNDSAYNAGTSQTQTKLTAGSSVTISKTLEFNTYTLSPSVEDIWDIKLGSEASGASAPLMCTVTAYTTGKYVADNIPAITFPVIVPIA